MMDSRKRLIQWAAATVLAVTALSSMGCSAMQGGAMDMRGKFVQAAASYEVLQVAIEAAVTSGQLDPTKKRILQEIDRLAVSALQVGRAALASGDDGQVAYQYAILSEATQEARSQLGRSTSGSIDIIDVPATMQYPTIEFGGSR